MKNKQSVYPVTGETVFAALSALALLIVNAVLFAYTNVHPAFTAAFSAIIYIAAVSVFLFVKRSALIKRKRTKLKPGSQYFVTYVLPRQVSGGHL